MKPELTLPGSPHSFQNGVLGSETLILAVPPSSFDFMFRNNSSKPKSNKLNNTNMTGIFFENICAGI